MGQSINRLFTIALVASAMVILLYVFNATATASTGTQIPASISLVSQNTPLFVDGQALLLADGRQTIRLQAFMLDSASAGVKASGVTMNDVSSGTYSFNTNDFGRTGWLRVGPHSRSFTEVITASSASSPGISTSYTIRFIKGNLVIWTDAPADGVDAGTPVNVYAKFCDDNSPVSNVPVILYVKYANGTTATLGTALTGPDGVARFANIRTASSNLKTQVNLFTARIDKLGLSKQKAVNNKIGSVDKVDHFTIATVPSNLNITMDGLRSYTVTANVGQPLTIIAQAVDANGNPVSSRPAFKVVFTDKSGTGRPLSPVTVNSKSVASMILDSVRFPRVVYYSITNETGGAATDLTVRYSNKPESMTLGASPNVIASSEVEAYRLNSENPDIKYAVNKSKIVAHVGDKYGMAVIEQPVTFTVVNPELGNLVGKNGTGCSSVTANTDGNGEALITFSLCPQVTGSGYADIACDCSGLDRQIVRLEYKPDSHLNISAAITPANQTISINDTFDVTLNIDGVGWQAGRKPIDLIFTVDTSGSMGDAGNNPLADDKFVYNPHSGWFAPNVSINNYTFPIDAVKGTETARSFIYNHTGNTRMVLNLVPLDPVPTLIADFTATSDTSGVKSVNVSFKDMTLGTPTAWQWNFGDGSANSTMQNPSHLYDQYGQYDVTLTAYNSTGAISACRKIAFVTVEYPLAPVANFNMNPTSGVAPRVVSFDSYPSTGDYITARTWNFGDGSDNVTAPIVSHTFPAGNWTVTLTVTNDGGSNSAQRTISVVNPPLPVANFSMNRTSGMWPLCVEFTDLSVAQSVEEYVWNFGDGSDNVSSATSIRPVHTFNESGTYTVTLYVKNLVGTVMAQKTISVNNPPAPTASFSASTGTTGVWPLTMNFADASSVTNPSVYPTRWEWNFGEGSNVTAFTSAGQSHVYSTPGTYTVTLTVSNAGGSSTMQRPGYITVNNPPVPAADFSTSPTTGTWPLQVTFTDKSSAMNPATYTTIWNWQFGDGSANFTSTSSTNPTHRYNTSGSYTVNLTVTNVNGSTTRQVSNAVVVSNPALPTVDFTPNKTSGYYSPGIQFCVKFTDNTVTPDPTVYSTTWVWDFGEGTNYTTTSKTDPVHTYLNPGVYTVKLYVTNPTGSAMSQKTVTLSTPPLMNVDFKANVTSGIYPLTVQFTDLSQQDSWYPDEYQWSFGDAKGNSSARHPVHTFDNAGTYTVTLSVHNPAGFNTTQKIAYITVNNPSAPVVNFVANKTSDWAGVPVTIKFNDTSTGLYMNSWEWDFGDNTGNVTERNTTHTYTAAGNYTVMLTVTNPGGSSTRRVADYIQIKTPPAATVNFVANNTSFYYPYGLLVKFNDTSSGIYMSEWYWDFGDGTTSTQRNVTHSYPNVGNYTVKLTVKNPAGNASTTKTEFIKVLFPAAPVANLAGTPTSGDVNLTVKFNDTTTGLFLDSWEWNFGDGSMPVTARNTSHVYTTAGLYNVTLTVTNVLGNVSTITKTNYINATNPAALPPTQIKPVCDFEANQTSGVAPMMVQFTDKTTVGQPQQWQWSFGDSYNPGNATIQNPVHTFTKPGDYTVILTVTNAAGSNSSKKINYIHVAPPALPVCNFSADRTDGTEPLTVTFTDLSTGYGISSWQWNFGDGTANSTLPNPQHTYGKNAAGWRTVTLTVTNDGGSSTCQKVNYINVRLPPAPTADFTMSPEQGTAPLQVTFTDRSTGSPTGWQWDFGDGHTSAQQNPINTYARAGNYTVTLIASNDGGSTTRVKYVNVNDPVLPVVDFSATPTSGYYAGTPFSVQFTDLTTGSSLTSWAWDFGDSTGNSSQRHPQHSYSGPGNYTVTLTVTNVVGATVTRQKVSYINITMPDKPVVNFNANQTEGVWPFCVQFTDATTGMFLGTRQWNFGDSPVNSTAINPVHTYTTNGTYNVTLMVTNPAGSVTIKKIGFITVNNPPAPTANFSASPTTGQWPLNVAFTDLSTVPDPTVYNTVWKWEFGDGVTATYTTRTNPTHQYNSSNTFNVKLTVTNPGGASSKTISNLVTTSNPSAPSVSFAANVTSGTWPLTVGFTDNTVTANPAVYPTTWQWNFGDGTSNVSSTSRTNPAHTFNRSGVFTVTLTVSNPGGSTTSQIVGYITVNNPAKPTVEFGANQTIGDRPLCVRFTDNTVTANPAVYPTTWEWSFGDGTSNVTSSSSTSPVHTYTVAGTYTVILNVTNPGGSTANLKAGYITVNNPAKPTVDFRANITEGYYSGSPFCVQFTDLSTGTSLQNWEWSFGDNTANSSSRNPIHLYTTAGTYTVMLKVTNPGGDTTAVKTGYIRVQLPPKPTADFTASATSGNTPLTVNFANTSTGMYISAMEWNFNDGSANVTGVQSPSHTFTHHGTYNVMLTVWNPGGSTTKTRTITVVTQEPDADFHASATTIKSGQQVTLYDDSTEGTPTEWHWFVFDGNDLIEYSNEQNPTFTLYADDARQKNKRYDILLTVKNEGGSDFKFRDNYILVKPAAISMAGTVGPENDHYYITVKNDATNEIYLNRAPADQYILQGGKLADPETGYISPEAEALPAGLYNITLYRDYAGGDMWGYRLDIYDTLKLGQSVDTDSIAKEAIRGYINQLDARDRAGLVNFSIGSQLISPLIYVEGADKANLINAVNSLNSVGVTDTASGMTQARLEFESSPNPEAMKFEILLTDGAPFSFDKDDETMYSEIYAEIDAAVQSHITIYTIGLASDRSDVNETLLQDIALRTGGKFYFVDMGDSLQLSNAYKSIGKDIDDHITKDDSMVYLITENDNATYVGPATITNNTGTYSVDPYNWPSLPTNGRHTTIGWPISSINLGQNIMVKYTMKGVKAGYTYPVSNLSYGMFYNQTGHTMLINITGPQLFIRNISSQDTSSYDMVVQLISPVPGVEGYYQANQGILDVIWNVTYTGLAPYTWTVDCAPTGTNNYKVIASGKGILSERTQKNAATWNIKDMNLVGDSAYDLRITATDSYGLFTGSDKVTVRISYLYPGDKIVVTSGGEGEKKISY